MAKEKASCSSIRLNMTQIFESNTNMSPKIDNLVGLLANSPLKILFSHLSNNKTVIKVIKWLTLLHNLVLRLPQRRDQLHELIDSVKVQQQEMTGFQALLLEKLIAPYKVYLFRRNMLDMEQQDKNSQIYQLINLLRSALTFTEVLYIMGRYMYQQYNFLSDFNVVLAKDLSEIYEKLKLKLTEKIAVENAEVLQKLNEGLYIVFYNSYFNSYVGKFAPVWINTERLVSERTKSQKTVKINNGPVYKEVEQKIYKNFLEEEEENNSSFVWTEEEPIKSASTIDSYKNILDAHKSRKEFIAMAEDLLQKIEEKEEEVTDRMRRDSTC